MPDRHPNPLGFIREYLRHPGRQVDYGQTHAVPKMQHRKVTHAEVMHILQRTGRHIRHKDEYQETFRMWKYRIQGPTIDKRIIAVVVSIVPPKPNRSEVFVVTVIAVGEDD